ncbi:hypothetical protein AQUCO_02900056v1 [Aquilegia coerulea]|uniref:NYN domain-containing protein n=1 Tax=Aquilegia coerulea TaxID=218851 RepID=A0A2G5D361_AQUCA|nr:hypothetical protein AQUCO_02900056v1 [Aquilegia coerulea]
MRFRLFKNGASINKILVDMLFWAVDNPAPANYLLISGDSEFSYALYQLRMRRYNILLAQPQSASAALVAAAKSVWLWTSILAGGPPLSSRELSQFCYFNKIAVCNMSKASVSESEQISQSVAIHPESSHLRNHKIYGNGDGIRSQSNVSTDQLCSQTPIKHYIAPHDFFTSSKRGISSSGSVCNPNSSLKEKNGLEVGSVQSNLPVQPNFAPDSFFRRASPTHDLDAMPSIPNGPTAISHTRTNIISIGHTENTDHPSFNKTNGVSKQNSSLDTLAIESFDQYHHYGSEIPHETTDPFCTSGVWGTPGCPEPSEYVKGLIGIVLLALHTLKSEKITPTEANITDCIRYGDLMYRNTDVRNALKYGIEHQMIVRHGVGALEMFLGKNWRIWNCVNPMGGNPNQYSKGMWDEVRNFLASHDGQFKLMASESRYEAAMVLKNLCLSFLSLGDVIQILNIIINIKKWIVVHPSGWQPISIPIAEITTDGSDTVSI